MATNGLMSFRISLLGYLILLLNSSMLEGDDVSTFAFLIFRTPVLPTWMFPVSASSSSLREPKCLSAIGRSSPESICSHRSSKLGLPGHSASFKRKNLFSNSTRNSCISTLGMAFGTLVATASASSSFLASVLFVADCHAKNNDAKMIASAGLAVTSIPRLLRASVSNDVRSMATADNIAKLSIPRS